MDKTLFLTASNVVNFHHPQFAKVAADLRADSSVTMAKNCLVWVRDNIQHLCRLQGWCLTSDRFEALKIFSAIDRFSALYCGT